MNEKQRKKGKLDIVRRCKQANVTHDREHNTLSTVYMSVQDYSSHAQVYMVTRIWTYFCEPNLKD